jgi:hypothetical protein
VQESLGRLFWTESLEKCMIPMGLQERLFWGFLPACQKPPSARMSLQACSLWVETYERAYCGQKPTNVHIVGRNLQTCILWAEPYENACRGVPRGSSFWIEPPLESSVHRAWRRQITSLCSFATSSPQLPMFYFVLAFASKKGPCEIRDLAQDLPARDLGGEKAPPRMPAESL